MATRIRLRYDTIAHWESTDATGLAPGEFGVALKTDNTIEVRVGNADPTTNNLTPWADAAQITSTFVNEFGDLDFTDVATGDILYYTGTGWDNASLISRFDVTSSAQNNIGIEEDANGVITLKYVTFTFNPTFTINETTLLEVRELYNSASLGGDGDLDITLAAGGSDNVSFTSASFTNNTTYTQNYDLTFNQSVSTGANAISLSTIDTNSEWGATIGTSVSSGFRLNSLNSRRDAFNVVFTPDSSGGYTGGNKTVTKYLSYGWRIMMLTSPNLYTTASALQTAYDNDPNEFIEVGESIIAPTGTSFPEQTINVGNTSGGDLYLYFLHSCNIVSNNDTFGWTPVFKDPNNLTEQFTDIATSTGIEYDKTGFEYKIHLWGTTSNPNLIGNGVTVTFKVS